MFYRILFISFFLIAGFSSQAQSFPDRSDVANEKSAAPGQCRMTARVVKILPRCRKISKQKCSNSPCFVKIKVMKINAYGSAFPVKFHEKQKLMVKLIDAEQSKTKKEKLKRGEKIIATIKAKQAMNRSDTDLLMVSYQREP